VRGFLVDVPEVLWGNAVLGIADCSTDVLQFKLQLNATKM
jgi:hypothetical protein